MSSLPSREAAAVISPARKRGESSDRSRVFFRRRHEDRIRICRISSFKFPVSCARHWAPARNSKLETRNWFRSHQREGVCTGWRQPPTGGYL